MTARAKKDPSGPAATDLKNLLQLVGWGGTPPDTLNDGLLEALLQTLFQTPCHLAVVLSSDLLGTGQRFNLPGSYGADTWCERLDFPLSEYSRHPEYAKRMATVSRLIRESGRLSTEAEGNSQIFS